MLMCVLVISLEKSLKQSRVASSSEHICQQKSLSHGTSGFSGYSWREDGKKSRKEDVEKTPLAEGPVGVD